MTKTDVQERTHEELYGARVGHPEIVDVPSATFLMLDGQGDPNVSVDYGLAIQALYAAAYTVKFALSRSGGPKEKVSPLEGLWWGAEKEGFAAETKDTWHWTMMIRLPESASSDLIASSLLAAAAKRPELPIAQLRVEEFAEGMAAQVMHLGPYADEGPTVAALHAFIAEQGRHLRGKHHEIYLGDPRRAAPAKLKTLIRQPVT